VGVLAENIIQYLSSNQNNIDPEILRILRKQKELEEAQKKEKAE